MQDPNKEKLLAFDPKQKKAQLLEDVRASQAKAKEAELDPADLIDWPDVDGNNNPRQNSVVNAFAVLDYDEVLKNAFKYNSFTRTVEITKDYDKYPLYITKKELDEEPLNDIKNYMAKKYVNNFKKETVFSAIRTESKKLRYNPVKEWINKEEWDKKERLDTFFIDYLGAEDTLYTRMVTRRWFCGAIARAYIPGIKFEMVPVLTGDQGLGKSTLISKLCPGYFSNELNELDKKNTDQLKKIHKKWIMEIEEMKAYFATDVRASKQFLSAQEDEFRVAYALLEHNLKRSNVFIGTNNEHDFLIDKTGNRRLFPIKCGMQPRKKDCNPFKTNEYEMQQVLAEAKARWENGEKIFIDKDDPNDAQLVKEVEAVQNGAMAPDEVAMIVDKYLNMEVPEDWYNYPTWNKKQYWDRWSGLTDTDQVADDKTANPPKKLKPIDFIQTNEIYDVAFYTDAAKGRKSNNGLIRKIRMVIKQRGWGNKRTAGETIQKTMPNGSRPRGYAKPNK